MRSILCLFLSVSCALADSPSIITDVEGQPLAANIERVAKALDTLGKPLPPAVATPLAAAIDKQDVRALQKTLDPHVLFVVNINPESRVKVARGPAESIIQQSGYTPVLVKIINESTVKKPLRIVSPQSGPVYSGAGRNERDPRDDPKIVSRFAQVEMHTSPPLSAELSGLTVEYAIALIYSSESGKREITVGFDVGQGNQDLGFRGEVPVLFDVKPAYPIKLKVLDFDGTPTVGRFTFKDSANHVYPPQSKRLGVDLFFQQQIYRGDGETVLLPPGRLTMEYGRGPEYRLQTRDIKIEGPQTIEVKLNRWINPANFGYFSGDHHIHAAGCAHYTNPTEGIVPEEMFVHVKGEGLNVGCCLTWGPCYDYQRKFFAAAPWERSEPFTILKYDVEVSGFGSQALGHVCLLNLRDQTYPGSEGTKTKGWPTWTTPLMTWAKKQGGVTGYAHSANGLTVNPEKATRRLFTALDRGTKGFISREDVAAGSRPLPESFDIIDADHDGRVTETELAASTQRTRNQLPNLNIPEMNGIGAQEICVTTALGVCDFISAMDTERVPEWNCWYHLLNCGFPIKVSGETDFPCISGGRVGQGRVYVKLGNVKEVSFGKWCDGIAKGQSYVSDGYAHAMDFAINGTEMGTGDVKLAQAGTVKATAKVAFDAAMPLGTAVGGRSVASPTRLLELVENGKVIASKPIPADGQIHDVSFDVSVKASSWYALRCFPQMHTNPVNVIVADKPIRASQESAKWCVGVIDQLWSVRERDIRASERDEAKLAFEKAKEIYRRIAQEAKPAK
ncbi:MAG: CehA/McbA family metallohydrolase [Gemmataceae bacterium]